MNYKALVKTFTPSKSTVVRMFGIIAFLIVLVAITFTLAISLNTILTLVFGEKLAEIIIIGIVITNLAWLMIGEPLYDRYKRIKREIEG